MLTFHQLFQLKIELVAAKFAKLSGFDVRISDGIRGMNNTVDIIEVSKTKGMGKLMNCIFFYT